MQKSRTWTAITCCFLVISCLFIHYLRRDSYSVIYLASLGGGNTITSALNDRGQIVGWSDTSSGAGHAFLWEKGRMRDLGTLGGQDSAAYAINTRGEVVGGAQIQQGSKTHAFLCQNGRMQDMGTLGGVDSHAYAINANDEIVGEADTLDFDLHAFRYFQGKMEDINPRHSYSSTAYALNDRGQILGTENTAESPDHVFLLSGSRQSNIDTLIHGRIDWTRARSLGINNRQQIIVTGAIPTPIKALFLSTR